MREQSRPVPSEEQTSRPNSPETISPEHSRQEHKGPFVGDLQEIVNHLEVALDYLTEKQGKTYDADASLERAAGIYALHFESWLSYQEDLQMFREALRVAQTSVSSEESQRVIGRLREWIKDTDEMLMGQDEFNEKYHTDRDQS